MDPGLPQAVKRALRDSEAGKPMPSMPEVLAAAAAKGGEAKPQEEKPEQPAFQLGGPIRPPAAPATYKALQKIRLRVAASRFADLLTSTEIAKGDVFRAIESKEDEDGTLFLKTDRAYENGWFMELGVIGKRAGKPVVKRVAGNARRNTAVHEISAMPRAEAMPAGEAPPPRPEGKILTEEERKQPILAMLEDPKVRAVFEKKGVSIETLKENPEFLRAVSRRLFGEEVVG